ncbi:MAG: hypothetical protein L0Y80_00990 [Ignavibacteriae bacterium]|nr:hypothetical protein [Ignavibacteriota bacterium]
MKRLLLLISIALLLVSGCTNETNPFLALVPSMSGYWDMTLGGTSGSLTGVANFVETEDALTTTLLFPGLIAVNLSGNVSRTYQVTLDGINPGERYLITGTVNPPKTTFSGKMDI